MLESLIEARTDIRQGIDTNLLERERSLQQMLHAKADRQAGLGGKNNKEGASLAKEIRALTAEYEELQGQIRSKSPRYAALTQPQPLGLKEIQEQVLDDQTLLLEYALGDERSYLWAVSRSSMSSYQLPGRTEIEKAARGVYELLTARQPKPSETPQQLHARVTQAEAQYWQKAASLSETLLGPVAGQLGTKRLLIVSEGALQYLPFAALPKPRIEGERGKAKVESEWAKGQEDGQGARGKGQEPGSQQDTRPLTPLIVDHEIVSLPSASVMAVLRRETQQRSPTGQGRGCAGRSGLRHR